jgi:hypothetical protein
MAFDLATRQSQYQAISLLDQVRSIYSQCKNAQANLVLYQAGTNAAFNAAINTLHPPAERTELNQMLTQINSLITDWETNHADVIGIA